MSLENPEVGGIVICKSSAHRFVLKFMILSLLGSVLILSH